MSYKLYHPIELNLLSRYFGFSCSPPPEAFVDIREAIDKEKDYVVLFRERWDELQGNSGALDNAVARILLESIQDRLPQWRSVDNGFNALLTRFVHEKKHKQLYLTPQHLLSVNWATSEPSNSWSEDYNLTYVPLFHRFVVTASRDNPDAYGYPDLAIGHFSGDTKHLNSDAGKIVKNCWSKREKPWENFNSTQEGAVDEETAKFWGWKVWGDRAVEYPPQWLQRLNGKVEPYFFS